MFAIPDIRFHDRQHWTALEPTDARRCLRTLAAIALMLERYFEAVTG